MSCKLYVFLLTSVLVCLNGCTPAQKAAGGSTANTYDASAQQEYDDALEAYEKAVSELKGAQLYAMLPPGWDTRTEQEKVQDYESKISYLDEKAEDVAMAWRRVERAGARLDHAEQ